MCDGLFDSVNCSGVGLDHLSEMADEFPGAFRMIWVVVGWVKIVVHLKRCRSESALLGRRSRRTTRRVQLVANRNQM